MEFTPNQEHLSGWTKAYLITVPIYMIYPYLAALWFSSTSLLFLLLLASPLHLIYFIQSYRNIIKRQEKATVWNLTFLWIHPALLGILSLIFVLGLPPSQNDFIMHIIKFIVIPITIYAIFWTLHFKLPERARLYSKIIFLVLLIIAGLIWLGFEKKIEVRPIEEKMKCEANGGVWGKHGKSTNEYCIYPEIDIEAVCKGSKECIECRSTGGRWGHHGFSVNAYCIYPSSDAGTLCNDSKDCEYHCISKVGPFGICAKFPDFSSA